MKQDLTGKRFGRLTVLKKAPSKNKKSYWLCRCECGNEKIVEDSHLKSGHTKSCGCYRKDVLRQRGIGMAGERYGRLLVLGPIHGEDGSVIGWQCQCDCGNICVCQKGNLRSGITRSCGCLQEEQRKENMKKAIHFVGGTCVERIACRKTFANNTTGHRGVYRRENNRWRASIGFRGRIYNLGTFVNYEDAVNARLEAEARLYDPFLEIYGKEQGRDHGKGSDMKSGPE